MRPEKKEKNEENRINIERENELCQQERIVTKSKSCARTNAHAAAWKIKKQAPREVDDLEKLLCEACFSVLGHERENIKYQPVSISPFVTSPMTKKTECGSGSSQHLPFSLIILISYFDVRNTPAMRQAGWNETNN